MRVFTTLLMLLFSMFGDQTKSTQTEVQTESQSTGAAAAADTTQLDVSVELRELRDMVVELRTTLSFTQNELQNTKSLLYKVMDENYEQKAELAVMKTEMMDLIKENAAQEIRLTASEAELEDLKTKTAAQDTELTAVKTRLAATETKVVNLEKEITEQPKVAFSAGLTNSGEIVSGNTIMNVVFTKIITNVGQAYSSITGFFTAPVKGVYYFRFTVRDDLRSHWMVIHIYKNDELVMGLGEHGTDGLVSYLSSGVALQLEMGDVVNMRLPAGYSLNDDTYNHSTFSGFLLFPL